MVVADTVLEGKMRLQSNISSLSSVQQLSCVWLFVTPWTAACQASLSITNSQSLLKLISTIASVMPSSHLTLCCPLLSCLQSFLSSGSFPMSRLFASGDQSIGASASVLLVNIQGWFLLRLTGLKWSESRSVMSELFTTPWTIQSMEFSRPEY